MSRIAQINQRAPASVGNLRHVAPAIPANLRIVVPIRPGIATKEGPIDKLRTLAARHAVFLLRLSLATVFLWFGVLKVAGVSPVVNLLQASIPFLGAAPYLQILGLAEIAIGLALLIDRLAKQATVLMIVHLLGTLSLVVIAPKLIFAPVFPVLTMDGEFVLKNVVLITSALVIMFSRPAARAQRW